MPTQPSAAVFPAFACVISATLWGVFWYPLRLLETMGVPGLWATMMIYAIALVWIIKPCWQLRHHYLQRKMDYFLLALAAGWTNLAFILAVLEGEVVRVLLLFYLSPVWAIVLARVILGERLERNGALALLLALSGALTMLWEPHFLSRPLNLADSYALSAGMAFAITNVLVRRIGNVHWSLKLGPAWVGVILICIIGIVLIRQPLPMFTAFSLPLIVITGFPVLFIMTWTAQYGVTHLPVQTSSVIFLLEIIAGAISASLLTSETISIRETLGGSLIVIAGLVGVWKKQASTLNSGYS